MWFRSDLRVADNPALHAASDAGQVVACFLFSEAQWRSHDHGERKLAFLRRSVRSLSESLAALGIPLHVLDVPWFREAPDALLSLMQKLGASHLHFNAEYPLNELRRDRRVWRVVRASGFGCTRLDGSVVQTPGSVLTGKGEPYTVFTPFKRKWLGLLSTDFFRPLDSPQPCANPIQPPKLPWKRAAERLEAVEWPGGEDEAHHRLQQFCSDHLVSYPNARDFPGLAGTSRLSAYLSVGAISPRQCLSRLSRLQAVEDSAWANELIWRDFYAHVIAAFPHVSKGHSFHRQYDELRWESDPKGLAAWQAGATGYPLVDAAMRQLNSTGWMHNRLRMVTAMFLTKHLLIDWRHGERYFMQQLVDGDFAANNGGWQWSASTGTDSAPYFRIFNPAEQGKKYDSRGVFTRTMIPALKEVPDRNLFEPWKSGLQLDYPAPIVEHAFARGRAIERFRSLASSA